MTLFYLEENVSVSHSKIFMLYVSHFCPASKEGMIYCMFVCLFVSNFIFFIFGWIFVTVYKKYIFDQRRSLVDGLAIYRKEIW